MKIVIIHGPTLSVKIPAISPITARPSIGLGYSHTAASSRKIVAITNDTTCPSRKSKRLMRKQRRLYSTARSGSRRTSTVRSLILGANGSKAGARPAASSRSRILAIPARLAFPHSDACSETSIPVGSSPRKPAITSQDPGGASKIRKCSSSPIGAGRTKYTITAETKSSPPAILAPASSAAYRPQSRISTDSVPRKAAHPQSGTSSPICAEKR